MYRTEILMQVELKARYVRDVSGPPRKLFSVPTLGSGLERVKVALENASNHNSGSLLAINVSAATAYNLNKDLLLPKYYDKPSPIQFGHLCCPL